MSPRPGGPVKPNHPEWIEPTREQQIKETRIAVLRSASAALESCAKVLREAAKALGEEA